MWYQLVWLSLELRLLLYANIAADFNKVTDLQLSGCSSVAVLISLTKFFHLSVVSFCSLVQQKLNNNPLCLSPAFLIVRSHPLRKPQTM